MSPITSSPHYLLKQTRLAAGVATCLAVLSGAAIAGASPEALQQVKAYGNVSLAQDSVNTWGPWEQFEPPSAGRDGRVDAPKNTHDLYRPLPKGSSDTSCVAGSVCGYAILATVNLPPPAVNPPTEQPSSARSMPQADSETPLPIPVVTPLPESAPPSSIQTVHVIASGGPADSTFLTDKIKVTLNPLPGTSGSAQTTEPLTLVPGSGYQNAANASAVTTAVLIDLPDPDAAPSDRNFFLVNYIAGGRGQYAMGVVGRVTSAADIAHLHADNATASYSGTDSSGGQVNIGMKFGDGTFTYQTRGGELDYDASGKIKGSNYNATAFQTANTTGKLGGSLFGANAAGAGGYADVTQNGFNSKTIHTAVRVNND